jgi:mRNA interferase RelE/StbE
MKRRKSLAYLVKWHEKAIEDLRGVDRKSAKGVIERVKEYLPQDPISFGKPLHGEFKGLYRYRYGRYRVLYAIDRKENTILILRVGMRKNIYNQL